MFREIYFAWYRELLVDKSIVTRNGSLTLDKGILPLDYYVCSPKLLPNNARGTYDAH